MAKEISFLSRVFDPKMNPCQVSTHREMFWNKATNRKDQVLCLCVWCWSKFENFTRLSDGCPATKLQ